MGNAETKSNLETNEEPETGGVLEASRLLPGVELTQVDEATPETYVIRYRQYGQLVIPELAEDRAISEEIPI